MVGGPRKGGPPPTFTSTATSIYVFAIEFSSYLWLQTPNFRPATLLHVRQGSNLEPPGLEPGALPIELRTLVINLRVPPVFEVGGGVFPVAVKYPLPAHRAVSSCRASGYLGLNQAPRSFPRATCPTHHP